MDEMIKEIMKNMQISIPDATLPDPAQVMYYVMEQKRKLFYDMDVDENVIHFVQKIYQWNMEDKDIPAEERKPIWLYIMSSGGSGTYMWALIDAIEASETPVYTVNLGMAYSAAVLIFLSGKKRFMTKHSSLIIHEGSNSIEGDSIKVMDASASYKKFIAEMKEFIVTHSEIPKQTLSKKRANDWEINAEYCLEHKACDVIIEKLSDVL